jgi:hypothetical protein
MSGRTLKIRIFACFDPAGIPHDQVRMTFGAYLFRVVLISLLWERVSAMPSKAFSGLNLVLKRGQPCWTIH